MECFVPKCSNTSGVPFPKQADLKKKWLENLKIKNAPNPNSFICLDHFEEHHINQDAAAGTRMSNRLKKGAEPTIIMKKPENKKVQSKTANEKTKMETDNIKIVAENGKNQAENTRNVKDEPKIEKNKTVDEKQKDVKKNLNEPVEENSKQESSHENSFETVYIKTDIKNMGEETEELKVIENDTETTTQKEINTESTEPVEAKLCILCFEMKEDFKCITEKIEDKTISTIIDESLHPIKVSGEDESINFICNNCYIPLQQFQIFKLNVFNKYTEKFGVSMSSEENAQLKTEKRKAEEKLEEPEEKKFKKNYDYDDIEEQLAKMEGNSTLTKSMVNSDSFSEENNESWADDSPEKILDILKYDEDNPKRPRKKSTEKKYNNHVEQELRRVLKGQLSEEQIQAENIIIAVESDDETERTETRKASISKVKLPIVIKPIEKGKKPKSVKAINKENVKIKTENVKVELRDGQVVLPRGISVSVPEKFESEVGIFECELKKYIYDTEFCLIDGYLFENRLCKGKLRYLRCVIPTCHSIAEQEKIESTSSTIVYSQYVTVIEPHNHKVPSEMDKKKQMFYYVMKRMMTNDKAINFKTVYEQVCEKDPSIKALVPLRNVINEICRHQLSNKTPVVKTFKEFCDLIEEDQFQKLHFTHSARQFYQEKFAAEDGTRAIVFSNCDVIDQVSHSKLMYVDDSFKIETSDPFAYQLVTVLVWLDDSYYPILFALISKKSQDIYKKIFEYLHDTLAPELRPDEIVTDYEANLYYALGETYLDSHIGGSVFYYTQNLYKKICSLNLARDLETNSCFRNIYHMLLMLPLLPVNTILDGLNNIEVQARDLGLNNLTNDIFEHVRNQWILKVTPDLFCVHRLENRINENVIAPFKKLRDFLMLSKGKAAKQNNTIVGVIEKLIDLEAFLQTTYAAPNKKSFARDLSSNQKKNVLKAWHFIENHPKININNFFTKVLGYIKCMENQLWIWGFYRFNGDVSEDLINATNFSIVSNDLEIPQEEDLLVSEPEFTDVDGENSVVMEAVIDENGGFVLQSGEAVEAPLNFDGSFLKYVYKDLKE